MSGLCVCVVVMIELRLHEDVRYFLPNTVKAMFTLREEIS